MKLLMKLLEYYLFRKSLDKNFLLKMQEKK
jgi:hypothetical protein